MRQPQVARLAALLLALVLAAPVALAAVRLLLAGAFLVEFATDGRLGVLTALTPRPRRMGLDLPGTAADRYVRPALVSRPLVLVHGFAPQGKDDPRAVQAGMLLARAGFDVAIPTVTGLTTGRLGSGDVEPVVAAVLAQAGGNARVGVIAVSIGAGPALLAAADPRVRERVTVVLSLGGYASAAELLRFLLTGEYAYRETRGRVARDEAVVRRFVEANADLVERLAGAPGTTDPRRLAAILGSPPPALGRHLDALSPLSVASSIEARLILVHGRADPAVPFTESLRLADARPSRTTVILLAGVDHVDAPGLAARPRLGRDLLALWGALYSLLAGS